MTRWIHRAARALGALLLIPCFTAPAPAAPTRDAPASGNLTAAVFVQNRADPKFDGEVDTTLRGAPFALSSSGEDVWLLEGDANGKLLKFVDRVEFAAAFNGETLGRWPNGAGTGTLISMTANTLGSLNTGPMIGPVLISEVMYHPEVTIEDDLEFVEICNSGTTTENLANWRLRGGADFDFTAAHSLEPGGLLVVVGMMKEFKMRTRKGGMSRLYQVKRYRKRRPGRSGPRSSQKDPRY